MARSDRALGPFHVEFFPVVSGVAGEGAHGEFDAFAMESRFDPADRVLIAEVVTDGGKIDELDALAFGDAPNVGMAVDDRLDVFVWLEDFEEVIDVDEVAVVVFERVMHENRDGPVFGGWQIFGEPIALGFAELAGDFVRVHQGIENDEAQ